LMAVLRPSPRLPPVMIAILVVMLLSVILSTGSGL
jgi:hypothetical protein